MTRPITRTAFFLAVVSALSAAAQERGGFGDTIGVELVSVDVLATTRAGEPIIDLTREDFRLFDNGSPVQIQHFSTPAATTAAEGDQTARKDARRRVKRTELATGALLAIFLDQMHLLPSSRQRAIVHLAAVLNERLGPATEVLVVSFDGTVEIRLSPTRDRKRLWEVLAEQILYGSQVLQVQRSGRDILHTIEQALQVELQGGLGVGGAGPSPETVDRACSSVGSFVRGHAAQEYGQVQATALALKEFVASMAAYPGVKTLLHVSDGIPLIAGQRPMDHLISLCDGSAMFQGGLEPGSILARLPPARYFPSAARLEMQGLNTAELWRGVAAEGNVNRVTLYTLQASGLEAPSAAQVDSARMTGATETMGRLNDQDPLFLLADETGGRAILNVNDSKPALTRMLDDMSLRYELAFYPEIPGDSQAHQLKLEVTRPGVRLHYRKSYASLTSGERTASAVLGALYHGRNENPHGLQLHAEPLGGSGKRIVEVDVEVRVPLTSLVLHPGGDTSNGLVTVFASARSERGGTLPVGSKAIPLLVALGDEDEQFRYVVRLPLRGSLDWVVAVALRDEMSGETSIATVRVRLP